MQNQLPNRLDHLASAFYESLQVARREVREGEGMIMKDELTARMRVLRRLRYLDDEGLVTQKGHVSMGATCIRQRGNAPGVDCRHSLLQSMLRNGHSAALRLTLRA
jgi:hypothetical protein